MKYSIGERVKISERAYENGVFSRSKNMTGTIVGRSRNFEWIRVRWDGRKSDMTLAEIFVEKLNEPQHLKNHS